MFALQTRFLARLLPAGALPGGASWRRGLWPLFVLAFVLLGGLSGLTSAQAQSLPANVSNAMGRVFNKLNTTSGITIAYLGGSITNGSGASNAQTTSWRAKTTKWFRDNYPGKTITDINAAIGGTGSQLGTMRVGKDVLTYGTPDLVFVEFAVNDYGPRMSNELSDTQLQRQMEGIVRRLAQANPNITIVFVYTVSAAFTWSPSGNRAMWQDYDNGTLPATVVAHQAIADKYGIQAINVGLKLRQTVNAPVSNYNAITAYLPDQVHPNDAGYTVYADEVARVLNLHKTDSALTGYGTLPSPLVSNPIENGVMVTPNDNSTAVSASGWSVNNASIYYTSSSPSIGVNYTKMWEASSAAAPITYSFTGTDVGVFFAWHTSPAGATIEYSIDGGAWTSSWNTGTDDRMNPVFFGATNNGVYTPLTNGAHTLSIRASGGGTLQILGFMSHNPGGTAPNPTPTPTPTLAPTATPTPSGTPIPGSSDPREVVFIDDQIPTGATGSGTGESWTWSGMSPAPARGSLAHPSSNASGLHQHFYTGASPILVHSGDVLWTYIQTNSGALPSEVMVQWYSVESGWSHRKIYGQDAIGGGTLGTSTKYPLGQMVPSGGKWVRLEIPAAKVGLEGKQVSGMAFSLYDGQATWDAAGLMPASAYDVWIEDGVPTGATPNTSNGAWNEAWTWASSGPLPWSGSQYHVSPASSTFHQHFYTGAPAKTIAAGDRLFAYVYLDPTNPPSEVRLQWFSNEAGWSHAASWGQNNIGGSPTAMGARPDIGRWVLLEVNPADVGLVGKNVTGMAFSLYGGQAYWDRTGRKLAP